MKKVIFSLLTVTLVGISCKKDDTNTPAPPAAVQYMSLSAGSTWNYELIDNQPSPATTGPFTLTSTSRDSTIATTTTPKTYHVFTNSSGSNEYYNITGNDYYNFRSLPVELGGTNVEYLYLKDNVAAGMSWSQTFPVVFSGVTLSATLTNTITDKGNSKTVKGIAYNNVIHVTTTIAVSGVPSSALVTDIEGFYAEKYGLIQSINKIAVNFTGITDSTNQQTNLNTADIK